MAKARRIGWCRCLPSVWIGCVRSEKSVKALYEAGVAAKRLGDGSGVPLAVSVSVVAVERGNAPRAFVRGLDAPVLSASRSRKRIAEMGEGVGAGIGDREAGELPHISAQLRDALAGRRRGHPHGAGIARTFGCEYDDDLHARVAKGSTGRGESAGSIVIFCDDHTKAQSQKIFGDLT